MVIKSGAKNSGSHLPRDGAQFVKTVAGGTCGILLLRQSPDCGLVLHPVESHTVGIDMFMASTFTTHISAFDRARALKVRVEIV